MGGEKAIKITQTEKWKKNKGCMSMSVCVCVCECLCTRDSVYVERELAVTGYT